MQDADKAGITHDMSPLCYCVSQGEHFFLSVEHDLGPLLHTPGFLMCEHTQVHVFNVLVREQFMLV